MIRKTLSTGGYAWSTSEACSSNGIGDDSGISFCWTWLLWKSVSGRDITSYSWSTNE